MWLNMLDEATGQFGLRHPGWVIIAWVGTQHVRSIRGGTKRCQTLVGKIMESLPHPWTLRDLVEAAGRVL
jgi:hypothetical protein